MAVATRPSVRQAATPAETPSSVPSLRNVRLGRVLWLALPLIVLNCGWIANSEIRNNLTEGTVSTLFLGVAFILFLLTLANLAVRRLLGDHASLNQAELMLIYTMLSMSSAIAGVSHIGFLSLFLASPFWHSDSNPATKGFLHYLPSYMGPRDPAVLQGFYKGNATFFKAHIVRAWAYPLIVWGFFLMVLLWTQLCLSSLLRRRWADEEHLPFPVIALPLEITREGAPIYRNRLFQAGFAIPLFFHSLNTLAGIYPTLPSFPINSWHDLSTSLSRPWNGVGTLFLMIHPVGVGFGYLVNTDALFSLWFFYLLKKGANVFGVVMGWHGSQGGDWSADDTSQFPFIAYQGWGAWVALVLSMLWTSRSYLRGYFDRALHGDPAGVDKNEALSARWAFGGLIGGFLALCVFILVLGGSIWLPIVFFGGYLLIMTALSRVRAEVPVLATGMNMLFPQALDSAIGPMNFSAADTVHVSMLSWFNLDYRSISMPQELEGMQGLRRTQSRLSPIVMAILVASAVAIVAAMLWDLQMYYSIGAESAKVESWRNIVAARPWQDADRFFSSPQPTNPAALPAMAFGAVTVFVLYALRTRFIGFPLVPAAYAMNMSDMNDYFWCDMFVAWVIKSLFLRYGGRRLYQAALPFFLGLILGDFATGAAWCLYGTLAHLVLFRTFPV